MIPAPLLALIRYAVVWECGRLVGHGWTFFALDPDTTDAVVQGLAMLVAVGVASIGALTARVKSVVARLKAHHKPALVAAATQVVIDQPALANSVVTVP